MFLNTVRSNNQAKHAKRRVGRGMGSGLGKTCGRGHKGQKVVLVDFIKLVLRRSDALTASFTQKRF